MTNRARRPPNRSSIIAAALVALTLPACTGARIGPSAAYEFGVPLTVRRDAGGVNDYVFSGDGRSANHTVGFGAAFELVDAAVAGISLAPCLALALSNGTFDSDEFVVIDDSTSPPISRRTFDVATSLSVAQLDFPVQLAIADRLALGVGPWASLRLSSGVIQTERIVAPESVTYPDGTRERYVRTQEEIASTALRGGMLLALVAHVRLADGLWLRPSLFGRVDGRALLVDDLGARSVSGGAGIALLLDVARPAPPVVAVDTAAALASRSAPPRAELALSLAAGASLLADGTLERVEMPLRPSVRFERGSAALPAGVATLSRERASRMSIDSFARMRPHDLQRHALDVLGMRMSATSGSTATIATARGSSSLAQRRVDALRAYLRDVWQIDPARTTVARDDGAEDEVRLVPGRTIDEPIVTRWVTRSYRMPRVALRHAIDAPAGVRWWEIVLRQNGRVVARASDATPDSTLTGALALAGGIAPIVAELTAADSAGRVIVALDTLVLSDHAVAGPIAAERRETVMLGAEVTDERVRTLAASIRPGARILIAPPSDARPIPGRTSSVGRLASRLLAELEARGTRVEALRVVNEAGPEEIDASAFAGGARLVVEQPYVASDN